MYNYNRYMGNDYFRDTTPGMLNNNQTFNNNKLNLYTPEEGYNKGNLFSDLYVSYKNYQPVKLQPANEQGTLLLELSQYAFAAHELNLYLDLHPEDDTMLTLFNDYKSRADKLVQEYESKYGPLTVSSDVMTSGFLWEQESFPWEGGNN